MISEQSDLLAFDFHNPDKNGHIESDKNMANMEDNKAQVIYEGKSGLNKLSVSSNKFHKSNTMHAQQEENVPSQTEYDFD